MSRFLPHNTVFPFYHLVCDEAPVHIKHLYPVKSEKEFKQDLEYLLKHYQPMDLEDVKSYIQYGKSRQKPGFFITFDDGLREIYEIVRPILKAYGIPAAFFINPDFVDNAELFYRYKASILVHHLSYLPDTQLQSLVNILNNSNPEAALLNLSYAQSHLLEDVASEMEVQFKVYLKTVQPYMTLDQIQILYGEGFYIGAHSMDHPLYSDISLSKQLEQTHQSMDYIRNNVHRDYDIFAFPFTDYGVGRSFFNSVKSDIIFGTAGMKNDSEPNVIHRIPMEMGNKSASAIINKESAYYFLKNFFNKNTIRRI